MPGGEGPPRAGALLVATPVIGDPNFERAVVLLLHHDESGSLGIVLNRPSELDVETALPAWSPLATPPGVVHIGGPVGPSGVLALARTGSDQPAPGQGWAELSPGSARSTSASSRASWARRCRRCASTPATRAGGRRSWPASWRSAPGGSSTP